MFLWSIFFYMRLTFKSGDLAPRGSPSLKWVGLIQPLENRKRIMTWLPWARGNLASWLPLHSNQHITGAPTCTCWTSQTSVITRAAWNLSSPSRFFFLSLSLLWKPCSHLHSQRVQLLSFLTETSQTQLDVLEETHTWGSGRCLRFTSNSIRLHEEYQWHSS